MNKDAQHYDDAVKQNRFTDEEKVTTTPGDLRTRFGWQGAGQVEFLDDKGDPLSREQWEKRLEAKRRKLKNPFTKETEEEA